MVTKAIIEEIVDKYSAKVRIPFFNQYFNASGDANPLDFYMAHFSTHPNVKLNYKAGDIVYVSFEDNDKGKPVILGQLNRESIPDSTSSITAETLRSTIDAYMPEYTYIGDVSPENIKCLIGANKNLQFQLDILSQKVAKLEGKKNKHRVGILIERGGKVRPEQEDSQLILDYTVNKVDLLEWQKIAADVNGDGSVTVVDASAINEYISSGTLSGKILQDFEYNDSKDDDTHTYGILIEDPGKTIPTKEDAQYVLAIAAGNVKAKAWQKIAADVNGDGYINSVDSLIIQQFIADPVVGQHSKVGKTFVYKED